MVRRILLTGMSGNGKSTVIGELRARGYRCADMDEPSWSEAAPDGEWIWAEERLQDFLSIPDTETVFVSGCASNQGKFYQQFDAIILLSAPADVLIERLAARTNNPYGKSPEQLAEVLRNLDTIEPLLRQGADHEIDTRAPIDEVVAAVLRIAHLPT
jgi:dephospho-CoA kinase